MAVVRDPATVRYERRTTRILFDLLAAPIGALLFATLGLAMTNGWLGEEPPLFFFFGRPEYLFFFFAALLAVASALSWRRGVRRQLLDVGPDGLRTPELGLIAWEDIEDLRIEHIPNLGGNDEAGPMPEFRRLGIVPRDRSLVAQRPMLSVASTLTSAYLRFVRRMGYRGALPIGLAPFGVGEEELSVPLDSVVDTIRRYHAVVEWKPPRGAA